MVHPHLLVTLASCLSCALPAIRVVSGVAPRIGAADAPVTEIVAVSLAQREAVRRAALYAPSALRLMLVGPTGSGKSSLARYTDARSGRSGKFVVMTGAELADGLAESELFGHVKGAFTDAKEGREGRIAEAAGGTLFLDDVSRMPLSLQAKLLRALDRHPVYRPVGAKRDLPALCRFIFGLADDPEVLVANGALLPDFRARMGESRILLRPLAERREDILPLAERYLRQCPLEVELGGGPTCIGPSAAAALEAAPWPRNVRELEGVIADAYVLARADGSATIELRHLPEAFQQAPTFVRRGDPGQNRRAVAWALREAQGRYNLAARRLGVHPNTIASYARPMRLGATA